MSMRDQLDIADLQKRVAELEGQITALKSRLDIAFGPEMAQGGSAGGAGHPNFASGTAGVARGTGGGRGRG